MAKRVWSDANNSPKMLPTLAPPTPSRSETNRLGTNHQPGRLNISILGDQPVPRISRKVKACTACRKHKIKCIIDDRGPPCRRCTERKLSCVLGKNLQTILDEKSHFSESVVQDLEQMHDFLTQIANQLSLGEPPPLRSSSARDAEGSILKEDSTVPSTSSVQGRQGPSCDNSPKSMPEDEGLPYVPIHSLYALTKLRALRSPDNNEFRQDESIDDFISRGSISLANAESLFVLYRDRLDPYIYSIGCPYKSLSELRHKSPFLTAAILTVAALHDPKADDLYRICKSEFRRLVEKFIFERRIDRDYLRAMCVASYWLSDLSWMLSGYAIRRAAEFNLQESYDRAIEDQSEEDADCARLWYSLYVCDQHLATLYGRPSIVQEDSSIQGWEAFLQSKVATEEDQRLLSQVASVSILRNIRELFSVDKRKPIPRMYLNHISQFRRQLDQWFDHWSGELREHWPLIGSFPRKGIVLHYNFAQLYLYSHVFRGLTKNDPIPHYFLDCTSKAISAAMAIIDLIANDPDVVAGIVGMPSYVHSMTAFACMFLTKVSIKYGGNLVERERVFELITTIVQQFRSQPAGKWHLTKLMVSGLERIAETIQPFAYGQFGSGINASLAVNPDTTMQIPEVNHLFSDLDGDLFLNYDMNFGLSGLT